MNRFQERAWTCLKEEEKQSLFLQMSNGKSAWEAGTIMKRSHYKYIEIRERSQKFFKMFTEYFEKHEAIFRPDAPVGDNFRDYIEGCIEKRLSRKEAARYSGDSTQTMRGVRSSTIIRNIDNLRISQDDWDKDTVTLIVEFDRWNNFRILPPIMQAPSAFKRRANEKHKIYIRYLRRKFPEWAHEKLIKRYKSCSRGNHERYWVALVSRDKYPEKGYYVFPVKPSEEVITEMSRFYIYIFKEEDDADTFGFMVDQYVNKTSSIPTGQKFWAEFRNILEEALNYKQVNYVDFNMKTLDMAYNTHLRPRKSRQVRDKNMDGVKRAKDDSFYQEPNLPKK